MPETEEKKTLRSAVEKAAAEQNIAENPQKETEETSVEGKEEKETPVKEEEEFKPDPEIEEAVNFYRALRDPNQQTEIIQQLALRAGLLKPNEKMTEKQEQRYADLLNEILGEEYPDLKDKLGKVFTAFEKESDAKLNALKRELEIEKRQKEASDFEAEFSSFVKDNKISETEAAKMLQEIQELPPSVGVNGKRISLSKYLDKIYKLAVGEKRDAQKEVERAKKIQQNLKERSTNLSSDVSDDRLSKGSRLPSIKEAINAAAQGIKFDE